MLRSYAHIAFKSVSLNSFMLNHGIEGAAGLCRCLQDDLAGGFAVFQSSLCFRRFRQRKHFINVQPEPALANSLEYIVCAPQQFFARAYEMAEHPA